MLLVIYRSVITAVLVLIMVGIDSAQSADSSPASPTTTFQPFNICDRSCSFSWRLVASTDYAIPCLGRYYRNRATPARIGKRPSTRCFTTAHVILGSGLTTATYCPSYPASVFFDRSRAHWLSACWSLRSYMLTLSARLYRPWASSSSCSIPPADEHFLGGGWVGTAISVGRGRCSRRHALVASIGLLAFVAPSYRTTYDCAKLRSPACRPMWRGGWSTPRAWLKLLIETDHDMRNRWTCWCWTR